MFSQGCKKEAIAILKVCDRFPKNYIQGLYALTPIYTIRLPSSQRKISARKKKLG
jgi:hypothetical protein